MESFYSFFSVLILFFAGFVSALIYELFSLFKVVTKQNLLVCIIADLASCILATFIFLTCIFKLEYGLFAFFEIVSFSLGIIFERIFVKNIFAFLVKVVYSKITILKGRRKNDAFKISKPS